MIRSILTLTLGSAAVALASPALSAPGGGHAGGPSTTAIGARGGSQGPMNASPNGVARSNINSVLHDTTTTPTTTTPTTPTTGGSQSLMHASPNGITHASPNSVLARSGVPGTALPG